MTYIAAFPSTPNIRRTPLGVHFPNVSDRADWSVPVTVLDEDGAAVDISAAEITVTVRDVDYDQSMLTATVDDGIEVSEEDDGVFTFAFGKSLMRGLERKRYDIGCVIEIGGVSSQLFAGTVAIGSGVVS